MAWWFSRRQRDAELLRTLLDGETRRAEANAKIEQQKLENDRRRMELEHEHIEEIAVERRKDREAAEELRAKRRQWAQEARERQKTKVRGEVPGMQGGAGPSSCPVCRNPGDPRLTAEEIRRHHQHLSAIPRNEAQ